ncbi:hypothetical protein ONZ45_g19672 [Pleurotus djamor]|nr:hypothetical protein ONZ45_g19672 [Pleurotus djamor]
MGHGLSQLYDEETHVILARYPVPQLSRPLLVCETLYRPQSRAMDMNYVDFGELSSCSPHRHPPPQLGCEEVASS